MSISRKIINWYRKEGRDLPWRKTQDPYRILVSEIMLQQTQVDRVKVFYKNWLKQFPTFNVLSQASNADVIHAWAGLGYNRRALALRDIAKQVIKNGVPKSREEWLELKGVGPYTSAALTAFSLRKKAYPIDTNIRRVTARLLLGIPFPDPKQDKELEELGLKTFSGSKYHYDIPQAIFDLATMYCKKKPDCAKCPMKEHCKSSKLFLSGNIEIPKKMVKKANERIHRNKKYPDRIFRGRILKLIRESDGGVEVSYIGPEIDSNYDKIADKDWLESMISRLIKDNFIHKKQGKLFLVH